MIFRPNVRPVVLRHYINRIFQIALTGQVVGVQPLGCPLCTEERVNAQRNSLKAGHQLSFDSGIREKIRKRSFAEFRVILCVRSRLADTAYWSNSERGTRSGERRVDNGRSEVLFTPRSPVLLCERLS